MTPKILKGNNHLVILIFGILFTALSGCSKIAHQGKIVPTPETGKATIVGQVLNLDGVPIKGITIQLAEVYRGSPESENGAFVLDTAFSPATITDENGFFVIANIIPGEYVLVVGDVENNNYTIIAQDNGRPRVWKVSVDQILDLGTLKVQYPARQ